MPIDFQCRQCRHMLRVPDDGAGKKSRCPQCGNIEEIPYHPTHAPQPYAPPPIPAGQSPYGEASQAPNPYQPNPYAASPDQSPTAGNSAPQRKSLDEVRSRVKPPAIGMLIVGSIFAMMAGLMAAYGAIAEVPQGDEGDVFFLVVLIVSLFIQLLVVVGAARMLVLKNYGLAMTASILCLVSGLCCQLALPFGIWAIVLLADADVRKYFT